jgi:hypothetical protein
MLASFFVALPIALASQAADRPRNQPRTYGALLELEQNWAQALAAHETLLGEASR